MASFFLKACLSGAFLCCIPAHAQTDLAAEFYDAALFDRAIAAYQQTLQECEDEDVRFNLAESYFQSRDYRSSIDLLEKLTDSPRVLFLLGLACLQIEDYDRAAEVLAKIDQDEAHLHRGIALFRAGRFPVARTALNCVAEHTLAQIYLTRIEMAEGDFRSAAHRLALLPKDSDHSFEVAYLQGEIAFQLRYYDAAVKAFEEALPKRNPEKASWYRQTLYSLGWSYLRMGDEEGRSARDRQFCLEKSEQMFKKFPCDEKFALALGQCYLTKAHRLNNEQAYQDAEAQLSNEELFVSLEAKAQALLLRAQAAATYSDRDRLYRQLTQDTHSGSTFYAQGWYLRGLNDFEEGEALGDSGEAAHAFDRSVISLGKAYVLLEKNSPSQAAATLKFQAEAYFKKRNEEGYLKALTVFEQLEDSGLLTALKDPDEIFYLQALAASYLSKNELALAILKDGLRNYPDGNFADSMLILQGTLFFRDNGLEEAEKSFMSLVETFPNSSFAGEALFFSAKCAKLGDPEKAKSLLRNVYESYPKSPFAAEAYFSLYTYRDYMQGERAAIKHLQAFPSMFSETPFLLNVHYLLGMELKRDRIRKKNLVKAIESFHRVETTFDELYEKKLLPREDLEYFTAIRYRATLERAYANLAVADASRDAKKKIYLEYSHDVFNQIIQDFETPDHPLASYLCGKEPYPVIQEESQFGLAQSYIKAARDTDANAVFNEMSERYAAAKITRGYYLSRIRYEQALIALRKDDPLLALQFFNLAEDAAKGKILTSDQKLDLWIQQSYCYRLLERLDDAILILSKAVNEDAVSALRLKAMYLRAEIYEQQGRRELARRQLESTAKKGGEWALKAKCKLDENY